MKKFFIAAVAVLIPWLASAQFKISRPDNLNSAESSVDYNQPKEYEIADITVTGLQFIQPEGIISVSGLKVGDRIQVPGEDISNAIRKIWNLSIVGDVDINYSKIEGDKIYLNIDLKERARLSRFNFKGIKKGEAETLTDKIKLIKGKIVTDALIKNTQLAVKKHFIDKGFFNAEVNIRQVQDSSALGNSVALVIEVDKNRKVKINSITFEGNEVFADKKLKRKLKGTKEKSITHVFTPSKFIRSKYEEDKQKLIQFYNSQGYRDALILSDTVKPHDERTIDIVLNLEEGKKYYFRDITWEGNFKYTDEQLSRVLGINKGDVYNVEELEKRLTFNPSGSGDITSLYMDDGYLFFNVRPVEVGVEGDSVDVEMRVSEGDQATISRVTVAGNTQTSDHVALREMYTIPGRKFSRTDVINTQRELSALGFFDPEKITPEINPNPADGTVDINWVVEEKPSDQIELSGGWGGFYGFVGTLGLTFNNFSTRKLFDWSAWRPIPKGDGQKLSLRVQASGPSFQSYSASFTEPWFGGKRRNALSVSVSHSVQSNLFGRGRRLDVVDRSFQITAFTVGLARRLQVPDNWFTLSTSASYLIYNLKNYSGFFTGFDDGISHNFTLNATLSRNTIDSPTFPRRGSSLSLSGSATPPWSKFKVITEGVEGYSDTKLLEYHKWMFDASWFVNLTGKLVLNTRAHMGFIGNYSGNNRYTPFERFYVGGNGLAGFGGGFLGRDIIGMRGYDNNALNPGFVVNQTNPTGGVVYNKFVTELRYPVSLNPAATIFVLGFLEGGNVWDNYSEFNPFRIRRAAGVGARIFMPAFGLIGIDWGYGFDPIPGAPNNGGRQSFQFTIGQQLR